LEKKTKGILIGLIGIILGIVVMVFPFATGVAISVIAGIALILLGIWMVISAIQLPTMGAGLISVIIGVIGIIIGILFLGNVTAVAFLLVLWVYLVGIWMIAAGLFMFFEKGSAHRVAGAISIILGIVVIGLGTMAAYEPWVLAILIGIDLIVLGILRIWGAYSTSAPKVAVPKVAPKPATPPPAKITKIYDSYTKTWFEINQQTGQKTLAK
jgi:uncharacterized membrane protein HdeD (DUF308 family)